MSNSLKILYDARDAMTDTLFGDDTIACKPGCSHCCKHAVFVSMAEARMIKDEVDAHVSDAALGDVKEYWGMQCDVFAISSPKAFRHRCAFLDFSEQCRIYEYRPFVCRWYNSRDAGNCARNEPVEQAHAPFDKLFMRLSQIAWAQADHGQDLSADNIRSSTKHWFMPAALLHVKFNHFGGEIPEKYCYGGHYGACS